MKNKLIAAVFLLISPVLYTVYCATYNMWDHTNYENRFFTTAEDIKNADYSHKSGAIDSFINDTVPFKNQLTALNSGINLKLFNTVQSDTVLLGQDNWLFQKNVNDSRSIDDYQGLNHYSAQQLEEITEKLIYLDSVLQSKGVQFYMLIPPNKEQVYSRYMPGEIPVVDISKTQQLYDYISANSEVNIFYPAQQLKDISSAEQVYYKYDTHWNNLGALRALQMIFDNFDNACITATDGAPLMDLANVSSIYPFVEKDSYYDVQIDCEPTNRQICFLHDSFGDMMIPIMRKAYTVQDNIYAHFDKFYISKDTNILLVEINERYLYRLFTTIDTIIQQAENL